MPQIFSHIIGESTLTQGFTIPKSAYSYTSIPAKGDKRIISIVYAGGRKCQAVLRCLNNTRGHVQVRYEGKAGKDFRDWLSNNFTIINRSKIDQLNDHIDISFVNDNLLEVRTTIRSNSNVLRITDLRAHCIGESQLLASDEFAEITSSIQKVRFSSERRQGYYNSEIGQELSARGWLKEQNVIKNNPQIRLKCDFRKGSWQLEIEFGNARTYYQDIVKFAMSKSAGLIKIGGLLVPDNQFAQHLCDLGKKMANEKRSRPDAKYSGMMQFEKAVNEFEYIKKIFNIPFFIAAVSHPKL